jgi:hypothetical protein
MSTEKLKKNINPIKLSELIDKYFREENTIWFDYIDHVKVSYGVYQKGLKYIRAYGRYEFYMVSEEGDEILIDVLTEEDENKLNNILTVFRQ